MSMYDHLKAGMIDAQESRDWDTYDKLEKQCDEVEELLESAYCVGALVTWEQLKRIREIRDERNEIRYNIAIRNGASARDAQSAIM